ncbi:MAG: DUF2299 family protein [Chloroflexi bacterium]|nr:DUF2299 family protein [Chloroflexota bacterium]
MADAITGGLLVIGLVALATVIGAAIWAAILNWDGPTVILLIVGLLAGTLFVADRTLYLYRRFRGASEATLRSWVHQSHYSIRNDPQPNAIFQFLLTEPGGRKVVVGRLKGDPELLTIGAMLRPASEDEEVFDKLTAPEYATLIADLQIEMARLGVGFQGIVHPLRQVYLEDKLLFDQSLDNLAFIRSVMFIQRAEVLFLGLLNRARREADMKDDP